MTVTLIENFRAVFYAPFYAAFSLGAYAAEGLDVRMQASADSSQVINRLLSGAGQVIWGGPMRLLHAHDDDPASDLVSFCEVVGRDPFSLVGRLPRPDFRMTDLRSCTVAVVSEVPTPWYCLRHDLRLAGIDPDSLTLAPPAGMAENLQRLRRGEVDVIQVYEPLVREALEGGYGHVWYAAASRGPTSYTTLNTTRRFLASEPAVALGMTRAIYRTQQWLYRHDDAAVARVIAEYFPDVPQSQLAACIAGYRAAGIWNRDPVQQRAGVEWLRDAMLGCAAIRRQMAFEELNDPQFAAAAMAGPPPAL